MRTTIFLAVAITGSTAISVSLPLRDTSSCPFYLPYGGYEFPHLIVPINDSNIAAGHSYFGSVSPNDSATIYNFDIPSSRAHQQCSLYFTFPQRDQLITSDFKWNGTMESSDGPGSLQLVQYAYNTGATDGTTGNSQPPIGPDPVINLNGITPGNAYKAWTGSCGEGGVMSWKLSSMESCLTYFQDWNLCAIGLWVVYEGVTQVPEPSCGQCPDRSKFGSHQAWLEAYMS